MRIVLDSNVLMAALGTHGLCEPLMGKCLEKCEVFVSEYLLEETARHLVDKFGFKSDEVAEAVAFLRAEALLVNPSPISADACRDPKDLPVLGTAQAAEADCLVTGDKDLLVLQRFGKPEILSPRQFYDKLRD